MKCNLLILGLTICLSAVPGPSASLRAATYYFSSGSGDDSRNPQEAQHDATPWRTLKKLANIEGGLLPGDSILFKRGDVFDGSIRLTCSGDRDRPLVLGAYGKGPRPVINGLTTLWDWHPAGKGIWQIAFHGKVRINMLVLDGREQAMGRYPNPDGPHKGYVAVINIIDSNGLTADLPDKGPDWTGGEVVIRKARWVLDRNTIRAQQGNALTYVSESSYPAAVKYGCFIQNHPAALDRPGEWYYDPKIGILGIYLPALTSKTIIRVSTTDTLICINGQSHMVFRDLDLEGANTCALVVNKGKDILVRNCLIRYSGTDAIDAYGSNGFALIGSSIHYTNNTAFYGEDCTHTLIRDNTIRYTGVLPGMGKGNSGGYEAILTNGDHLCIEGNTIDSTGYIPVTFRGSFVLIRHNFIDHFCLVKDDGGAIYTWNNPAHPPVFRDRQVTGNIILGGQGAGDGTEDTGRPAAHGIYMDDNAGQVNISGNTIAGCNGYGIFIHNAHDLTIRGNTCFANKEQWVLAHDGIAPNSPVTHIVANQNVFFSLSSDALIKEYKMKKEQADALGAFIDNRYICMQETGKVRFEYNASALTKLIFLRGRFSDAQDRPYRGVLRIPPYSSILLIKKDK